jgi:hypothetical protein
MEERKVKKEVNPYKECKHCGSKFIPEHMKSIYCSIVCYRARIKANYDAKKNITIRQVVCAYCKTTFETNRDNKVYCSIKCRHNANCDRHPVVVHVMNKR